MFGLFRRRSLEEHLRETKTVKISGVLFTIKKINMLDYLNGSKVLKQTYDTYKTDNKVSESSMNQIKEMYTDVILASVIKPKLTRKEGDEGIHIEEVFRDWDMASELYSQIMSYTYGKKKMKLLGLQSQS